MAERIYKTWGQRIKLHEDNLSEVCYLILNPRQRCSYHNHDQKSNFFFVLEGSLTVTTQWGEVTLGENEFFTVHPPDKHEFSTGSEPTKIIEVAFVKLNPEDINRDNIGGPIGMVDAASKFPLCPCGGEYAVETTDYEEGALRCKRCGQLVVGR